MSNPTILFLIDTLNTGGAERSLLDIASRFKRYKPIVCHIYSGDTLKGEFEGRGIQTYSLNIPGPYNWDQAQRSVKQIVEKVKPVIIHSSLFKSDIISRRVAPALGIPLVNSLVNNSYHLSRFQDAGLVMKLKLKGLQWFDAWTSRKVSLFISNSETIKQSNGKALGIPLKKIKVIYRGRSADDFKVVDGFQIERARKELGIAQHEKVMLNVSRLIPRKGQMELIRAFRIIANQYPDVLLLIAGEGSFRADLQREINLLNLTGRVKMLGNRKDIPVLMKMADCFVFPSHYEGLPGVLIEAMLARLPIAASSIPENLECINAETAYLFNSGDGQGLISAINTVLKNKEESRRKAELAYGEALEKFAISKIAETYETTYDELLSVVKDKLS